MVFFGFASSTVCSVVLYLNYKETIGKPALARTVFLLENLRFHVEEEGKGVWLPSIDFGSQY